MLYGDDYKMWVDSRLGEGTTTGIDLPEQAGEASASSALSSRASADALAESRKT